MPSNAAQWPLDRSVWHGITFTGPYMVSPVPFFEASKAYAPCSLEFSVNSCIIIELVPYCVCWPLKVASIHLPYA